MEPLSSLTHYIDLTNAGFELVAGLVSSINVFKLMKDKKISGVHWAPTTFFTLWGFWNMILYSHLSLWFSFFGGLSMVIVNVTWLALVWRYRNAR